MPFEIRWNNDEQDILLMNVIGDWKLDEYYEKYLEGKVMMESVQHPVFLILDMSKTSSIPSRMMSTASFSRKNRAHNLQFTVFVGASLFIRKLAEIMTSIVSKGHKRLYFAENHQEARAIIANHTQAKVN